MARNVIGEKPLKIFSKRRVIAATLITAATLSSTGQAASLNFFTIGTGGTAYTYYPVGGVIANAISKPPSSRDCDEGGSCGVEGLIGSAVSSRGSIDNVNGILSGLRDSGFAQSDIAYWAYTGSGTIENMSSARDLRTIASLYEEHIHLVAAKDSGINSVADLKGKRVSLDEPGSGTSVDAKLILEASGLSINDISTEALNAGDASIALRDGKLDAFFVVAGYPVSSLVELTSDAAIKLIPIDGKAAKSLTKRYKFLTTSTIPEGTYEGSAETATVAVTAQWFTSSKQSEELIYNITKALWNEQSRMLLDSGPVKGKNITAETALVGIGVPLHPGAKKYYREAGLLK